MYYLGSTTAGSKNASVFFLIKRNELAYYRNELYLDSLYKFSSDTSSASVRFLLHHNDNAKLLYYIK